MKVRPPSCGPPPPSPQWKAVGERRARCKRCGATVLKDIQAQLERPEVRNPIGHGGRGGETPIEKGA
eukprot:468518-Lingulodinium_polyedra.AAC.1